MKRSPSLLMSLPAVLFVLLTAPARGHYVSRNGVGTAIQIVIGEDRIHLTYDMGFGAVWARAEMLSMDTDRDLRVSEEEATVYRRVAWETHIAPALEVRLNGIKTPVRLVGSRSETLVGEVGLVPFDVYYDLEIEIPYAGPEERKKNVRIEIINRALEKDATLPPFFFVPYGGHAEGCSFLILEPTALADLQNHITQGAKIALRFEMSGGELPQDEAKLLEPGDPGASPPSRPPTSPPAPTPETPGATAKTVDATPERIEAAAGADEEEAHLTTPEQSLVDLLRKPDGDVAVILLAAVIAFVAGAGHALQPGHGKTMVAAYLVGTRGRIRDAVLLGGTVTLTHTLSVFVAGLVIYAWIGTLDKEVAQNRIIGWFGVGGGALLIAMGTWIFIKRLPWAGHPERMREAASAHSHSHAHTHDHDHDHGNDDHRRERPNSMLEMITLGIAGGIVPCPGGLMVLSLGLQTPEHFGYALVCLVIYSLGLGSVLVAVGVLLVTGRTLLLRPSPRRDRVVSYLPMLAALFITGLGAYFVVANLLSLPG